MMSVDAKRAGALLVELRETGRTIPELPDGLRPGSWEEAYAIQDALHDAGGWEIGALKVGCTGSTAQEALGIDQPIAGRVPVPTIAGSGARLDLGSFHHPPLLECEVAFRLGVDVEPGGELGGVHGLVDAVAGAIELVDTRYDHQFGVSGPSTVADNSGAAAMVLGAPVDPSHVEPAFVTVALATEGAELATGTGAAVLGDPYRALAWVLAHEARRGRAVPAGTWVITGTCTGLTPCPTGETVTARFDQLGEVALVLT